MKKIISLLLTAALLAALVIPASAAGVRSFPDVSDSRTASETDTLRMLGVLAGYTDGTFHPYSSLTRAEFCAMTIRMMGLEGQTDLYRSRTIFPDVRSNHWAQGYINLAVAGPDKIIAGMPDGTFSPDTAITYAQAVTILLRALGYTDADAGMQWPEGYVALAAQTGLNTDLGTVSASSSITRAQAARLFCTLLTTEMKNGGVFAQTRGALREDVVILAIEDDARIRTTDGLFASAGGIVPASISGKRGALLLDSRGRVLTFLPDDTDLRTVTVTRCESNRLTGDDGMRYPVTASTPVWSTDGASDDYAYAASSLVGAKVTLYLQYGSIVGILQTAAPAASAVVVRGAVSAASFAELTDDRSFSVVRDGKAASFAELQPYDVATYAGGVLTVSSLKLSGVCSSVTDDTVTVSGVELPLCTGAKTAFSTFLGKAMTVLLTADGKAAAAENPKTVPVNAPGLTELALSDGGRVLLRDGVPAACFPAGTEFLRISAARSESAWLMDPTGARWTVPTSTPVYSAYGEDVYGSAWMDIRTGTPVTLCRENGAVTAAIVWNESSPDAVIVRAPASAADFSALTGGKETVSLLRNGQPADYSDLQDYDTVTYAGGVLCACDTRITAQYENAAPNTVCPSEMTVLGTKFELLPCAMDSASRFSIGSTVTLLLTADGRVAAVEDADTVSANGLAMVAVADDSGVTLELPVCGLTMTVPTTVSYASLEGQPVSLAAAKNGKLSLLKLSPTAVSGDFSPAERKLGSLTVSAGAQFFERVGKNGALLPVSYPDLLMLGTVPAEKLSFVHTAANGQPDLLIFTDLTGNCYEYGFLLAGTLYAGSSGEKSFYNHAVAVRTPQGVGTYFIGSSKLADGTAVGLAGGADGRLAGLIELKAVTGLVRADFRTIDGRTVLTVGSRTYPVSDTVACCNAVTGTWFASLADARAFSNSLTAYLDPVSDTVRLVQAN